MNARAILTNILPLVTYQSDPFTPAHRWYSIYMGRGNMQSLCLRGGDYHRGAVVLLSVSYVGRQLPNINANFFNGFLPLVLYWHVKQQV